MISQRAVRKTDTGTIVLHWLLAAILVVLVATGLRIAADSAGNSWLLAFDFILPKQIVWTAHVPAAVALFAVAVAYTVYIARTGLIRRIQPDRARLGGLFGRRRAFVGAINVLLYWVLFTSLSSQFVTGALLYVGYGGEITSIHLLATWIVLGYVPAHVVIHFAIGGVSQILRIVQPTRLPPAQPKFDPLELLAVMSEAANARSTLERSPPGAQAGESRARARVLPSSRPAAHGRRNISHNIRRPRRRDITLQAHPLAVAAGAALVAAGVLLAVEKETRDALHVHLIAPADRPVLDGDIADPVWRTAQPVTVMTQQGANFDSKGETAVQIRAVHDGQHVYFAFVWDDPTRSLKHLPLIKTKQGWRLLHEKYDRDDEDSYFEDKFAVLLTTTEAVIPGDRTFHSGRKPLSDKPANFSGRGLHYTTDGTVADVWEWKATSSGGLGFADDDYFGPAVEPTNAQMQGQEPYKGGFSADPGSSSYTDNFERRPPGGYDRPLLPRRLPKDWQSMRVAMGAIDLNPDHGEAEDARWWMSENESAPYSAALDAKIPVGAIIPGVIVSESHGGDRADVQAAARWSAGRWTLEVARKLDTKSPYDVPIATGTYLRVAAFDHSQSHHTRAVRPIRLEVETCRNCAPCLSTMKNSSLVEVNCFSTPH